jgi:tetratricopeptide (TPR) repeat protein
MDQLEFGRVMWGRNSLRLHLKNDSDRASSLAIRIRSYFPDSGSGILWEATYPALLSPGDSGALTLDYFVRPDHGRLRIEVGAQDGEGRALPEVTKEVEFEAPYRGDYVLQPYQTAREGVAWEGRILPPFKVRVSEHFIVYYFPSSDAESDLDKIVLRRERILQRLCREMGVEWSGRAVLFLYPDAEVARKLTGHRGDGWTYGRTVVEVYGARRRIDPNHEMVHLVASRIGAPPVLFSEGLATSREQNFDNAGRYAADVEAWCRGYLREGELVPLEELMTVPSLGEDVTRPRIAYPESACFVRYLLEQYGWEKFRTAYAQLAGGEDPALPAENLERFQKIFGVNFRVAEAQWKENLSRSKGRRVPEEMIRRVVKEETVPYLVARGRKLLTSGSVDDAERILRSAAEKAPEDLEAAFWLAQALHLRKDYPAALSAYGRVIRSGDRSRLMEVSWSLVWSGQILDLLGRRGEALEDYRKAESLGDETPVRVGGRMTTSLEAAREAIARPFSVDSP